MQAVARCQCETATAIAEKATKKKGSHTEDDDIGSIASATTLSSIHDLGYDETSVIDDDPFEAAIDGLYEKRSAAPLPLVSEASEGLQLCPVQSDDPREGFTNAGPPVYSCLLL